ncbi:MAG: hypothetical protein L3J82_08095 [Planctomycetes bacterium]|nr:hypothetical protein [Planctomycetota bacterium]
MHPIEDHIISCMTEFREVAEGHSSYALSGQSRSGKPNLAPAPYLNDYGWFLLAAIEFAREAICAGYSTYSEARTADSLSFEQKYLDYVATLARANLHRLERRLQEIEDLKDSQIGELALALADADITDHLQGLTKLLKSGRGSIAQALEEVRRVNQLHKQMDSNRDPLSELDNLEIGLGKLLARVAVLPAL